MRVILPLTLGFILADTVIKHDKSRGNVKNFKMRKNNSPGYEIIRIASSEKRTERKLVPGKNIQFFYLFQLVMVLFLSLQIFEK